MCCIYLWNVANVEDTEQFYIVAFRFFIESIGYLRDSATIELFFLQAKHSLYKVSKTPVTHSQMYRRIGAGFLIWKMLSDLRIILSARTAICNVCNVLVASDMDAMCLWGCHGKIKLLEFSVKALRILSVIDIRSSSVSHL